MLREAAARVEAELAADRLRRQAMNAAQDRLRQQQAGFGGNNISGAAGPNGAGAPSATSAAGGVKRPRAPSISVADSEINLQIAMSLALNGCDPYSQLGLSSSCDSGTITRRFRLMARFLHPDKAGAQAIPAAVAMQAAEAFKIVAEAHALLTKR